MSKTSSLPISSTAYSAVIVLSACPRVEISEDVGVAGWPTTDFYVLRYLGDTPKRVPAGQSYVFDCSPGLWHKGETAGYVKAVASATTMIQDEDSV